MSHGKEREEKVCLNCGEAPLYDRYCHHCGQQNLEPKQTVWHLLVHFFNDITHFDGKFFSTMKLLLQKPGFLSDEYVKGRRMKYLDPVRMYIFISAVFFIAFYNILKPPAPPTLKEKPLLDYIDTLRIKENDEGFSLFMEAVPGYDKKATILNVDHILEHGREYYDSVQKLLPVADRDKGLSRLISLKTIDIYQAYDANPYNFVPNAIIIFQHSFSKIFFITLPLFALLLYILNIRHRKKLYYVAHAIFSIHYYCVAFLFLSVMLSLFAFDYFYTQVLFKIVVYTITAGMLIYLYIAMLKFYRQHWFKTFTKFLILSAGFSFIFLALVTLMFFNSLASAH